MTSTFAWLDFDEPARQRMREIVELLRESGSVDELGLGRIRDAFSDRFFPGTSVLWRRARYLMFVAWTYQYLEREGFRQPTCEAAARLLQRKVRNAILDSGDRDGLIGLRRADPVSPPDVILWAALEQWGIRDPSSGTLAQYRASLPRKPHRGLDEDDIQQASIWNVRLPVASKAFPHDADFALEQDEAEFLRDLVLSEDAHPETPAARRADSLFAELLRVEDLVEVPAPWLHPLTDQVSPGLRRAVHMGGCFSDVMHGATLLYSRRLAELREDEEQRDEADKALAEWADAISTQRPGELIAWAADLDSFFAVVNESRTTYATERTFVSRWAELALADPGGLATSKAAIDLVQDREAHSKGGKARLTVARDKDRGDGGGIPRPLTYRWANAFQLAQDIRDGLGT